MKSFKFKSLTMRIWSYFVAMIMMVTIFFLSVNYFMIERYERERVYKNLHTYQDIILDSGYKNDMGRMQHNMQGNKDLHEIKYFFAINDKSKTLVFDKNQLKGRGNDKEVMNNVIKPMKQMASYIDKVKSEKDELSLKTEGIDILFLIKKVKLGGQDASLIVFSRVINETENTRELTLAAITILVLSLIVSRLIAKNISKPLKELQMYTEKIAKKEWTEPLEEERADEIGALTVSMNKMQNSLKNADDEERTFLQSISHDLKTPVMVIKSYSEAILDGVFIEDLEETAKIISNEATKLEQKIKQLIYFNSLNYLMENEKTLDDVRIDSMFMDLYERFKLVRSDIKWDLMFEEATIKCNSDRLTVAFENIIDNQLRYAKEGISIKIYSVNKKIRIEIYNDGPPINEGDLEKIFDRFYKAKKGNFGLGLAITQKIISFYKGTIKAQNKEKGVLFTIDF